MEWLKRNKIMDRTKWHKWFAWYPVTVETYDDYSNKKVWLEYVWRLGILECGMDGQCDMGYEYMEIERN